MHAACRLSPLLTAILCIISSEWCYNCHILGQYATDLEIGFDCVFIGKVCLYIDPPDRERLHHEPEPFFDFSYRRNII